MFLTAFKTMIVFMLPGGPLIIEILPRRNVIFFSPKIGHGSGSGSPAETPRLTSRLSERMPPPLALGFLLATASLASTGVAVDLYVVITILVPAWTMSLDSNEAIVMRSAHIDCLRYSLQVCGVAAHFVVAQMINDQASRVPLSHVICSPVGVLRIPLARAGGELAVAIGLQ
jgi:hypothetical protein